MRLIYPVIKVIFIFILFSAQLSYAGLAPSKIFNRWVKRQMQIYQIPAVSIVLIRDYKIGSVLVFGVTDLSSEQSASDTTLFQAGSISKPVTAVAILKAAQDGQFSLDDDISDLLTSWKPPSNPFSKSTEITVKELLSHNAGFNVPGFIGYAKDEKLPTLLDILNGTGTSNSPPIRVIAAPGEKYIYSGGGYSVLQQLSVDTYHIAFSDLMDKAVLQPLSMSNSTFNQPLPENLLGQIAKPYRPLL